MFDLSLLENELNLVAFLLFILPFIAYVTWLLMNVAWHLVKHSEYRHIKSKIKKTFNISDFNPKPCPFCGSDHINVVKRRFFKFDEFALQCAGCGMATEYGCAGHIIGLWNNRANDSED